MRFASFDISSTPEDQYQTFGARTDVLALRVTLSQLPQQDLIGYDTATAQSTDFFFHYWCKYLLLKIVLVL